MSLQPDVRGAVSAHLPPDYATALRLDETLDDKEYPTEDTQTHLNTSVDQKRERADVTYLLKGILAPCQDKFKPRAQAT